MMPNLQISESGQIMRRNNPLFFKPNKAEKLVAWSQTAIPTGCKTNTDAVALGNNRFASLHKKILKIWEKAVDTWQCTHEFHLDHYDYLEAFPNGNFIVGEPGGISQLFHYHNNQFEIITLPEECSWIPLSNLHIANFNEKNGLTIWDVSHLNNIKKINQFELNECELNFGSYAVTENYLICWLCKDNENYHVRITLASLINPSQTTPIFSYDILQSFRSGNPCDMIALPNDQVSINTIPENQVWDLNKQAMIAIWPTTYISKKSAYYKDYILSTDFHLGASIKMHDKNNPLNSSHIPITSKVICNWVVSHSESKSIACCNRSVNAMTRDMYEALPVAEMVFIEFESLHSIDAALDEGSQNVLPSELREVTLEYAGLLFRPKKQTIIQDNELENGIRVM